MTESAPTQVRLAFGDGFEQYASADLSRLLRLATLLTRGGDTAHDLTQETLVRVGLAWGRIARDGNPAGFATTTMSRLAWRQRRRRLQEWSLLSSRRPQDAIGDAYRQVDDADLLSTAMRSLGARQRAVLVLRYCCDMSVEEAAHTLGCSPGTVKSQAARGLARLRAAMAGPEEDDDA